MKGTSSDRPVSTRLKVITFAARCLGVVAIVAGAVGVFSFVVFRTRISDLIYGLMSLFLGAELLRAKLSERNNDSL